MQLTFQNSNKILLLIFMLSTPLIWSGDKYNARVEANISMPQQVCLEGENCGQSAPEMATPMTTTTKQIIASDKIKLSEGSEHEIKMLNMGTDGAMVFEPAVIKVSVGDTIHFKATDAAHNSVSVEGMIPAGAASWASQLSQDFSITLDTEGIYVYQCDPHLIMAMIGVIQVGDAVNQAEILSASQNYKSKLVMNSERLDKYLSKL
jgi:pseudoazurin